MMPDGNEYLVSFGRNGGLGRFRAATDASFQRGVAVVVRTARGLETGSILCAATGSHVRLLDSPLSGELLRPLAPEDQSSRAESRRLEQRIFERASTLARERALPVAFIDAEVPLQREQCILQFLGAADDALGELVSTLSDEFSLAVRLESLSQPQPQDEEAGCDEPNCGKKNGGCTSCSTDGGCSSCGAKHFDIRQYFGHLREGMEKKGRVAIL